MPSDPRPVYNPGARRVFAAELPQTLARISRMLQAGYEAAGEPTHAIVAEAQAQGIPMSTAKHYRLRHLTETDKWRRKGTRYAVPEVDLNAVAWLGTGYGFDLSDLWPGRASGLSSDEDTLLRTFRMLSPTARESVLTLATAQAETERVRQAKARDNITEMPVRELSAQEREAGAIAAEQATHEAQAEVDRIGERHQQARQDTKRKRQSNGR